MTPVGHTHTIFQQLAENAAAAYAKRPARAPAAQTVFLEIEYTADVTEEEKKQRLAAATHWLQGKIVKPNTEYKIDEQNDISIRFPDLEEPARFNADLIGRLHTNGTKTFLYRASDLTLKKELRSDLLSQILAAYLPETTRISALKLTVNINSRNETPFFSYFQKIDRCAKCHFLRFSEEKFEQPKKFKPENR